MPEGTGAALQCPPPSVERSATADAVIRPPDVGPVAGSPPEPGVVPGTRPAFTDTPARCDPEEWLTRATAPKPRRTATTRAQVPRARPALPGRRWLWAGAGPAPGVAR